MIGLVPESTKEEMEAAVESCKAAFSTWKTTSIISRQQCMFRLQELIRLGTIKANFGQTWTDSGLTRPI